MDEPRNRKHTDLLREYVPPPFVEKIHNMSKKVSSGFCCFFKCFYVCWRDTSACLRRTCCCAQVPDFDKPAAWAIKQTMPLVENMVIAATSHGLGTSVMEGYDAKKIQSIL